MAGSESVKNRICFAIKSGGPMVRTLACLRHGVHIAGSNPGVSNFFVNAFSFLKHLVYINDGLIPYFVCLRSYNNLTFLFIYSGYKDVIWQTIGNELICIVSSPWQLGSSKILPYLSSNMSKTFLREVSPST